MIPRFKSIVSRILWLHIGAIVATSVAVIVAVYLLLNSVAASLQKQVLQDHADTIAFYLSTSADGNVNVELPPDLRTVYAHGYSGFAYAIIDRSGRVLFSSRATGEPILDTDPRQDSPLYFENFRRKPLYYGASIPKQVNGQNIWIQVAQDLENPDAIIDDIVAGFSGRVAWVTIPIMLFLVGIDIVVVRRALSPVIHASDMAQTINPGRMDLRLPTQNLPSEVLPLIEAINQALDRLEAGFRLQRDFTADAAHELRTPLSVLRTRVDNIPDLKIAGELRSDIESMSRIVEQLFAIAELEHSPPDLRGSVDLQDICSEVVEFIAPLALTQNKEVALGGTPDPVLIKGDRHALFQAVRNLAENALRYTAEQTTVEIAVQSDAVIRVLDHGPGISESDRDLIFHRFWRGDRRRTGNAGLGLSIVSRVVEAHGGSVSVENRPEGGAAFLVTLTAALKAYEKEPN